MVIVYWLKPVKSITHETVFFHTVSHMIIALVNINSMIVYNIIILHALKICWTKIFEIFSYTVRATSSLFGSFDI